jgi:peptidoglycan-N-acetylglucosamine deacetylase
MDTHNQKPIASLSLDLDNKWSYMKTHGDPAWESFPSYLDIVVPRVLEFLQARDLKITFFVVGQDAALEKNHAALKSLAEAGHEIGNHSFNHEPWLHLYSEEKIEAELAQAEAIIEAVTGQRPRGFRGPGFSLSQATLQVLQRRGYQYDCSTFPTYLGPLARAYYFMTARLTPEEKEERKKLFGTLSEGLRPNKAYRWQVNEAELVEIPVTTMPIFKIPIHVSYVLYLSNFSKALALFYFRVALFFCWLTGVQPSLLLHPLDFLGNDDTTDLDFFPAMRQPSTQKVAIVSEVIRLLGNRYQIKPMKGHVEAVLQKSNLPIVEPRFDSA